MSQHTEPACPLRIWSLVSGVTGGQRPVILIDGGSGSGKTTLARLVVENAPVPTQLVSLDACYPGWDGLAEGSRMVVEDILRPERPGYRRWDWERHEPAGWVELDPATAIVVEGCGAITPASAELATLAIWLEMPVGERKRRALARDGETFARQWDRWAAQDEAHRVADRPAELADLIIRTSPPADHETASSAPQGLGGSGAAC